MTCIEVAIVASMELGRIVYPEYIEAAVKVGGDISILTPDAIITLPIQAFHNYITDWLEVLIEI
ncbi:MAG: hypothetical protein F6K25_04750 [Okeania sp. SIO2G4]|uniref:hypothetical protein n=1 Tax=unclassified Okeania TaxID=2634635 RepID=UPI0013B6ACC7|nr:MULTISPECIES: hypothetical protein [unclassified Okeania]NEP41668.1 hypothetical protein [Okeania sp. SIO2H7]NEP74003.1 hypothetical protein [Okeania sp. SIO2G5]NEP97066.1 hypothetical protein [Okeania sp. SIO2F5]NEQ90076.1 hypothetical protein [Okeania sp. SIO2G4]